LASESAPVAPESAPPASESLAVVEGEPG